MKPLKLVFLFVLISISFGLSAQDDKIAAMGKSVKGAYYTGSIDERHLTSKETDATYKILIYLPVSYPETQRKYPIMIITDAFWAMGIVQNTFDMMTFWTHEIPEVIVVGIAYPYSSLLDMSRNRHRDLLPTYVEGYNPSGSADRFINFIKKELIPYVENNYRVDTTDKCFTGHSYGGLLGSHILLEQPHLFNRYIIGSPSYWWDNKEITKRLSTKSYLATDSIKAVYTFIGGKESQSMINNWKEFDSILIKKLNKNIKFHDQIFQDETHMSVVPAAFSTAIKFVYKK
jgi:predicted alpha/beta superfamily hydrolase